MARVGASGRIAQAFIDNKLTPLLTLAALLLGLMAVVATPPLAPISQIPMFGCAISAILSNAIPPRDLRRQGEWFDDYFSVDSTCRNRAERQKAGRWSTCCSCRRTAPL